MVRTAADVTPEEMQVYRAALRGRESALQAQLAERRSLAWEVARAVAAMLRERHDATDVVLFGSLARGSFHLQSDIDLVVSGLDDSSLVQASIDADALARGLRIELVPSEYATGRLATELERDGISLP